MTGIEYKPYVIDSGIFRDTFLNSALVWRDVNGNLYRVPEILEGIQLRIER